MLHLVPDTIGDDGEAVITPQAFAWVGGRGVRGRMLCELHEAGSSWYGNSLDAGAGGYLAALRCDELPRSQTQDDHVIRHGFAVGFGQWFFFAAVEPALAFGRAARMLAECTGYGAYAAAHELMFCEVHRTDERVLYVHGDDLDRNEGEVAQLKRFVQAVKEHPWSSHWHAPTG